MNNELSNEQVSKLNNVRDQVLVNFPIPDESHNFRVTSDNLPITEQQLQELELLASAIPNFLNGFGKLRELCLYWR